MAPSRDVPAVKAALFDMDGLLIDSEDKYTICTNAVLHEYGRPSLPWNIKAQMQGRPGPTAGKVFAEWAQLPVSRDEYMEKVKHYQKIHFPDCKPLPGAVHLLQTLTKRTDPPVQIALATSSHKDNFKLKTEHMQDFFSLFAEEHKILGDDSRIGAGRGKPAPDIYLLALKTINDRLKREGQQEIKPEECLVFEDSVPGVESGRRAGMQVIWCPHPELLQEYKGREKEVLAGLTGEYKEIEEKNQELGTVSHDGSQRVNAAPGEIDDGFGLYIKSLVDFPYEKYGIKVKGDSQL